MNPELENAVKLTNRVRQKDDSEKIVIKPYENDILLQDRIGYQIRTGQDREISILYPLKETCGENFQKEYSEWIETLHEKFPETKIGYSPRLTDNRPGEN